MNVRGSFESGRKPLHERTVVLMLALAVSILAVYSNTLHSPFHFDDFDYIFNNQAIRNVGLFGSPGKLYSMLAEDTLVWYTFKTRYLGYLSFAVNYALGGLSTTGYHVFNISVHAVNSMLFYLWFSLTLRTPLMRPVAGKLPALAPFAAALLFAVHPVQTQAVTYISQRFASMAAMFCLISFVFYIKWRLAEDRKKWIYIFLSTAAAAAAMKTKEISFMLPPVIAVYEFVFFEGRRDKRLLGLLPVLLTMLLVPAGLMSSLDNAGNFLAEADMSSRAKTSISRGDYFLSELRVLASYIRLLFLPINQNFDYDMPLYRSIADHAVLASGALNAAIFVGGLLLIAGRDPFGRISGFGIVWFYMFISVESSFIPTNDLAFEHRMYLPSMGFFTSVVSVFFMPACRNRIGRGIIAAVFFAVFIFLGAAAYARNGVWAGSSGFWADVIKKSPGKARAYNELGRVLYAEGRLEEAGVNYQAAIRLDPAFGWAHNNLGIVYYRMGRYEDAEREITRALLLGLRTSETYNGLGAVYFKLGLMEQAEKNFMLALKLNPNDQKAWNNLGVLLEKKGLQSEAEKCFENARMTRNGLNTD